MKALILALVIISLIVAGGYAIYYFYNQQTTITNSSIKPIETFDIDNKGSSINSQYISSDSTFKISNISLFPSKDDYYYYYQLVTNDAAVLDYKYTINKNTKVFTGKEILLSSDKSYKLVLYSITIKDDVLIKSQFALTT